MNSAKARYKRAWSLVRQLNSAIATGDVTPAELLFIINIVHRLHATGFERQAVDALNARHRALLPRKRRNNHWPSLNLLYAHIRAALNSLPKD